MPIFEYLLVNKKKETVSSTIEAADKLSAINNLRSRGQLIKIEEKGAKKELSFSFGKKKTPWFQLAFLFFVPLTLWQNTPKAPTFETRSTLLLKTLKVVCLSRML